MSNPDRGAYTPPTEQPLSFDARRPVRGRGKPPVMLIVSLGLLAAMAGGIFVVYRSGATQSSGPPPVVGTPVGAIKGAAKPEAQPAEPGQGLQIYQQSQGPAVPSAPNFTPSPEQPLARQIAQAAAATSPVPAPISANPLPPGVVMAPPALKPAVAATAPAPKPKPVPSKAAPPAAAKVIAVSPVPALAVKTPAVVAKVAPVVTKPVPMKAVAATPTTAKPQSVVAKPAAQATTPTKPSGGASVQIGAFSSQALADKGWNDAAKVAPGAAAGRGKHVEAIQKAGATLYRTTVTGFASHDAAVAFCDQLKAAGKSCFVK